MAAPISFTVKPRDPQAALRARVEAVPHDHAEAILAALDILQLLYDRGLLDIARGALAAGEELLEVVVDAADMPETLRAVRNLLKLRDLISGIEPEALDAALHAVPAALERAAAPHVERDGLWRLLRRASSEDSLRGLTFAVDLLESIGRHLRTRDRDAVRAGTSADHGAGNGHGQANGHTTRASDPGSRSDEP